MKRIFTSGDIFIWMTGAFLALCILLIVGMLLLISINGFSFFHPTDIHYIKYRNEAGELHSALGQIYSSQEIPLDIKLRHGYDVGTLLQRHLIRVGNREFLGDDFRWINDPEIVVDSLPPTALCIEREEYGHAYGFINEFRGPRQHFDNEVDAWTAFQRWHPIVREQMHERQTLERRDVGKLNYRLERLRLQQLKWEYQKGRGELSEEMFQDRLKALDVERASIFEAVSHYRQQIDSLSAYIAQFEIAVRLVSPQDEMMTLPLSSVVRAYRPNALSWWGKTKVYLSKVWEFVADNPREANAEGGVFPAIFGTALMVLIMTIVAVPFGVLAALYLREYAKQGFFVRLVRIAVNNLAGVPSIVYGMFGLGFFVYLIGGSIDALFFPERLPSPTYGTGGILWASLTLALLTVPVVIVATEEALAAIPRGMREGSLALGATKWETIRRVVIPSATPGIMTGAILAMARGAGEVAPLMITGVVKLATEMPFDGNFPFFHLDRKFMHLGFHIYDVGFQTSNVEANIGMVYTTTLLLICLVLVLNLTAIIFRARLRNRYRLSGF